MIESVQLIKKVLVKRSLHGSDTPSGWPKKSNAALRIDHAVATLFVKHGACYLEDGWSASKNDLILGWHFDEDFIDRSPEKMSYRHLIDFQKPYTVVYFFNIQTSSMEPIAMFNIATRLRNFLELNYES